MLGRSEVSEKRGWQLKFTTLHVATCLNRPFSQELMGTRRNVLARIFHLPFTVTKSGTIGFEFVAFFRHSAQACVVVGGDVQGSGVHLWARASHTPSDQSGDSARTSFLYKRICKT